MQPEIRTGFKRRDICLHVLQHLLDKILREVVLVVGFFVFFVQNCFIVKWGVDVQ